MKQLIQFSEYLFTEHQRNVGSALHAWDPWNKSAKGARFFGVHLQVHCHDQSL